MLAQQKQQAIKEAFRDWIWRDPDRRRELVQLYNERFNSTRPREYDGRHLIFPGMNPEITLREHQLNAIAHDLYGGNTLLAHEVGAGKTFEMIAAAMEGKRLGLCQKSLFAVPNHLTEQWASEFLQLYPSANILVATKKDFEPANRKRFCSRIATGDYDAVIIGHSQFERIPLSYERQERIIQEQIDETLAAIEELKANAGENFSIKQMEKTRKTLETKLQGKKELQQQVLAYAKTKPTREGLRAQKSEKARAAYRQAHESDFIIADAAARYFKAHGITKLPARKALQAEIEQLISEKDGLYNTYHEQKQRFKELQTVKRNIDQILRRDEPHRRKEQSHER